MIQGLFQNTLVVPQHMVQDGLSSTHLNTLELWCVHLIRKLQNPGNAKFSLGPRAVQNVKCEPDATTTT